MPLSHYLPTRELSCSRCKMRWLREPRQNALNGYSFSGCAAEVVMRCAICANHTVVDLARSMGVSTTYETFEQADDNYHGLQFAVKDGTL